MVVQSTNVGIRTVLVIVVKVVDCIAVKHVARFFKKSCINAQQNFAKSILTWNRTIKNDFCGITSWNYLKEQYRKIAIRNTVRGRKSRNGLLLKISKQVLKMYSEKISSRNRLVLIDNHYFAPVGAVTVQVHSKLHRQRPLVEYFIHIERF